LARDLKAKREIVRGKPENFNRPDYNFKLVRALGAEGADANAEPTGAEPVEITTRQRGSPLDLIVAEAMILANSTWGGWLAELGVPGIYRSQASMAPGIKVRMGTKAMPHAGMGVAQYAWCTSPLRRFVDLVNQWQLIACARHGRTAALAAPFKPKDAALFAIISAFDAAYATYNDFQNGMERYWTLRWLEQHPERELEAAVIKPGVVRADTLPLVFELAGTNDMPRAARVRARINKIDLLTLDLYATLAARLDDPAAEGAGAGEAGAAGQAALDDEADDMPLTGGLNLAIDVNEGDAASAGAGAGAVMPAQPAAAPVARAT
jgi:exoribonuclease II